jgi:hypothetical protein
MTKVKLADKVQSLVDTKQYDAAIKLLANVDSPHATDWIRRIEALRTVHVTESRQHVAMWLVLSIFGCIAACSFYLWFA